MSQLIGVMRAEGERCSSQKNKLKKRGKTRENTARVQRITDRAGES